jgi:hypothetical protein
LSLKDKSAARPVSFGLLPEYSYDPSQYNDTSVRSSVRTTEGLESHGSGSNRTPECIPSRTEGLPVPRGVEDKCGDNIRNRQVKTDLFRIWQAAMPAICIGISTKTRRDYICFVTIGITDVETSI